MTKIQLETIVLTDVDLILGDVATGDDYSWHVSKVELVPTAPVSTWKGMSPPSVHQKVGTSTWVMNLDTAQDWKTEGSLSRFLHDNHGQTVPFKFKPQTGTGEPAWGGNLIAVQGPVGGTVDQTAVGSIALPIKGQPVPDYDDNPVTPNPEDA